MTCAYGVQIWVGEGATVRVIVVRTVGRWITAKDTNNKP